MARSLTLAVLAPLPLALVLAAAVARAQDENPTTPGAIPDPSTYQGSMQLQEQGRANDAQIQQQNQQALQRLDRTYAAYSPNGARPGGGAASVPPLKSKPLLPAAKNPLLGRWVMGKTESFKLGGLAIMPGVQDMADATFGGGCANVLGKPGGRIAFTPTQLNWVAPDGHEEILNHVEYRGDAANVIVIPTDSDLPLIFGMTGHDHAVVAFLGCTLSRASAAAASAPPGAGARAQSEAAAPVGQAILNLTVGVQQPNGFSPAVAGTRIAVTRQNPDAGLISAGFAADASGAPIDKLFAACNIGHGGDQNRCRLGTLAMLAGALGVATTDAAGHTQTGALPPGRYYLVGFYPYQGHELVWHLPVDLAAGTNALTLTPQNGSISH